MKTKTLSCHLAGAANCAQLSAVAAGGRGRATYRPWLCMGRVLLLLLPLLQPVGLCGCFWPSSQSLREGRQRVRAPLNEALQRNGPPKNNTAVCSHVGAHSCTHTILHVRASAHKHKHTRINAHTQMHKQKYMQYTVKK